MDRKTLLCLFILACHDASGGDAGTAPAVSYANVKVVTSAPSSSAQPPHEARTTVCRVISATGSIHRDSDAGIAPNDVLGEGYATLTVGSRMAVKNGSTTREAIFEGPGEVRGCVGGDEEMWVTGGTFKSVTGAGETPGAEVWVVTPQGVVRYGSGAQLNMLIGPNKAELKVTAGSARVFPVDASTNLAHDAGTDGWYPVSGTTITLTSKQSAGQLVGACEQAAKSAHDLAVAIETHDASLTDAAPRHVALRQQAHAVCAVAELVAARSFDLVERERLLPRAHAANTRWRDATVN
jgi:hypothetical protein